MDKPSGRSGGLCHFEDETRALQKPRRSSASPRIRELASMYEPIGRDAAGSRSGSSRSSGCSPSVNHTGPPISPRASLHIPSNVPYASKRLLDGLPNTGGAYLPTFSTIRGEEERKTMDDNQYRPSLLSGSSPIISNFEEDVQNSQDESATLVGERSLISTDADSTAGSKKPPARQLDTSLQPYPSHQVFGNDAYPLHLPHLDDYLTSEGIFKQPHFSDARTLCTEEEYQLYGYGREDGDSRPGLEVCGAQLKVPIISEGQGIRHRKRSRRKSVDEQDILESAVLTKQGSPSFESFDDEEKVSGDSPELQNKAPISSPSKKNPARSAISEANHFKSRLDKFPPLMLLEQDSLIELKSNAVGPRKPPGVFVGYFTHIGSLLGIIIDFVIGVEGSSLAAGIFRLQLFMDFVQLTNLNSLFLNPSSSTQHPVNKFLLITLPSLLALNFVSVFGFAVIIFLAWTLVVALLLLAFWRMTVMYNPNLNVEGYDSQPWLFRLFSRKQNTSATFTKGEGTPPWRSTPWTKFTNIMIVVLLTILYIPLGKLSLDALVWNADYWPSNAANQFSSDPSIWRDPVDICYTTTMRKDEFNWAYVIVTVAAFTMFFFTLWFPYQLRRTITTLLPRVPQFNELGQERSKDDLNAEYVRLLQRDSTPLSFMYQAYKRDWGNYKPLYLLFFKFSNIFVISVFAQDNCLWRNYDAKKIALLQQTVLIAMQTILLIVHVVVRPFIDQISNRSELVGRVGYVIDDLLGLLVVVHVKNAQKIDLWLVYVVSAFTYTANIYFALASTSFFGHLFKRLQKRLDFSIDVFSPFLRLDMHIKRRVWQESLSTLLLTGTEYHMPLDQLVSFSVLPDDCPPYLLSFQGTAAERHIENLKIVKQIGIEAYKNSIDELRGKEAERWKRVIKEIQLHYTGPDSYWKPFSGTSLAGVSSFFGKAFLIPFPPTLAIRYDQLPRNQNSVLKLTTVTELETYVWQNASEVIQRRKWVRTVLRALDGQRVYCPHIQAVDYASGGQGFLSSLGDRLRGCKGYSLARPIFYSDGVLQVNRNTTAMQDGYNFESGFRVSITYDYGQQRDADGGESIIRSKFKVDATAAFGLRDDFEWTASVQRFFHANRDVVDLRMSSMENLMQEYRTAYYFEAKEKRKTMSYSFLTDIFDRPLLQLSEVNARFHKSSCSEAVCHLPLRYPATMTLLLERLNVLNQSSVHRWWFLFWDDLWRLNAADYKALQRQKRIFSPQFPTSIAWTPLPRSQLEDILKSKGGLWSETKKKMAIFTPGLLNQIYFTMEDLAFNKGHSHFHPMHLGVQDKHGTIQKATASLLSPTQSSRLTGGGTDNGEGSILDRHEWAWTEQRLSASSRDGPWQAVRRFLSLNRYTPNNSIKEIWVYVRLIDFGNGQWRYEAESSAPYKGPPSAAEPPPLPLPLPPS